MAFWKLSIFVLAVAVGYLARTVIGRYQEQQRERALAVLSARRQKRRSSTRKGERLATWLFGAMTGWSIAAYMQTHNWELGAWALFGMYGLLDIAALNAKLTRRVTRRRTYRRRRLR
jgi:hypothetical protein